MRLRGIKASNIPPIKSFEVEGLSDLVVIAGQNGVGKTRLIQHILAAFRHPASRNVQLKIELTSSSEKEFVKSNFNSKQLAHQIEFSTSDPEHSSVITSILRRNARRRNLRSSVFYYESNRAITRIQPFAPQHEYVDPFEENVSWELTFQPLSARFTDTQHAIFKKIHQQKLAIATAAMRLKKEGKTEMNLNFGDPIEPFREAFERLLGPKKLAEPDLNGQQIMYEYENNTFHIETLSSGEREVLNITFDFLLRKPSDCIVFFDEPELHLHPELLSRLINTLRSIGENNQFILVSHSPEVISSSLSDTVIFLTPPNAARPNQAVVIGIDKDAEAATEALHRLGQSVGVVALGKKIVLIEGKDSSLDKQTYSQILRNRFPNLALLPSGGKGNLQSFETVTKAILDQSIWGVEFYMLADRDAAPSAPCTSSKFRTLSRYHLENYFLDEAIIAACFKDQVPESNWLRNPKAIEQKLRDIATRCMGHATNLIVSQKFRTEVGNLDISVKGCHAMSREELCQAFTKRQSAEIERIQNTIDSNKIREFAETTFESLSKMLENESSEWKVGFPGKRILATFASEANLPEGRLKSLFLTRAADFDYAPFEEIIDIFASFAH